MNEHSSLRVRAGLDRAARGGYIISEMTKLKFAGFRKLRAFVRDERTGKEASSLGLTVPKEAIRALVWKENDLLQVWCEEEKSILIIQRVSSKYKEREDARSNQR